MSRSLGIASLLLLLLLPPSADAFATYLMGNVGCMTDLSTDEVIMNSPVVAAADSDHPKVHLAVVPRDEKEADAVVVVPKVFLTLASCKP